MDCTVRGYLTSISFHSEPVYIHNAEKGVQPPTLTCRECHCVTNLITIKSNSLTSNVNITIRSSIREVGGVG